MNPDDSLLRRRYWPTLGWQDYYMGGMRDHFHFHRDIVANASRIVHHIRQRCDNVFSHIVVLSSLFPSPYRTTLPFCSRCGNDAVPAVRKPRRSVLYVLWPRMHRYGMGGFNALHDRTDDFKDQFPHYYVRFPFL